MTDKPLSETVTPANTTDNQMAKGKSKNITNRNQSNMAPSEPSSPTIASPGYPNTPEEQDLDLKSHGMMLIGFQEEHNNSLKEVQENMRQQIEVQKKETQKFL